MVIIGISPDERLVEILELPSHPWYVAGQLHPEFKSSPTKPHPLFETSSQRVKSIIIISKNKYFFN
jgi:CTP synthase (UTP-ammonia lyase)